MKLYEVKLNCNILCSCHRLFISVVNILQTIELNDVPSSATVLYWPPPSSPPKPLPTDREWHFPDRGQINYQIWKLYANTVLWHLFDELKCDSKYCNTWVFVLSVTHTNGFLQVVFHEDSLAKSMSPLYLVEPAKLKYNMTCKPLYGWLFMEKPLALL